MKKALKIIAIVLVLFFLLVIAAALTLPHLVSLDRYKGMIEAKLEQVLQREVTLGGVQITILPVLGATIEDFVISNPPTFSTTPFLSLKVLRVKVKLLPLLLGRKEIGGVTLQRPAIFVERDKKGRLNMPLIDEKAEKGKRRQLKSGRVKVPESKVLQGFHLSRTLVKGAKLVYVDRSTTPVRRIEIQNMDLDLRNLSWEQKITYDISVKGAPGGLSLEGSLGPLGKTLDPKMVPLQGRLRVNFPSLGDLAKNLAGDRGTALQGSLKGDLTFSGNTGSALKIRGEIALKALSLEEEGEKLVRGVDVLMHPEVDFSHTKGEIELNSALQIDKTSFEMECKFTNLPRNPSGRLIFSSTKSVDLEELAAKCPVLHKTVGLKGNLALKGELRVPSGGTPVLSMEADSSKMEIAAAPEKRGKKATRPGETPTGNMKRRPSRSKLDVQGRLRVREGRLYEVAFKDLLLVGEMRGGKLEIQRCSLATFGGKLEGSGSLNGTKEPPPFQLKTRITGVEADAVLSDLTSLERMMKGRLFGDVSLGGTGFSAASLRKNLTGKGKIRIREGELSWLNIVGQIVQALGGKGWGKEKTTFDDLSTSFTVQRGKISFPDILISHKDMEIRMWGDVGLDLRLDMEGEARLSPSVSNDLSGREWRYLKDERGRATVPFTLRGDLKKPQVGISTRLIERGLEGVIEELLRKKLR